MNIGEKIGFQEFKRLTNSKNSLAKKFDYLYTIIKILSKYNRSFQKKKRKTTLKNTLYCHVFLKAKNFNDQAIKNFDPISSKGKRAPLKTIKSNPNRIASTVHFETDPPLPRRKFMRPSVASIGCNVT